MAASYSFNEPRRPPRKPPYQHREHGKVGSPRRNSAQKGSNRPFGNEKSGGPVARDIRRGARYSHFDSRYVTTGAEGTAYIRTTTHMCTVGTHMPVPVHICPSQSYSVGIDREYYVRRSFRVIAMRVCCVCRVDWLRCIEYSFVYILNEREACRPGVAYSDIQRLSGCTTERRETCRQLHTRICISPTSVTPFVLCENQKRSNTGIIPGNPTHCA